MEPQEKSLSPLLTIWFAPRQTIRRLVDADPHKHVYLLAILSGIILTLNRASSTNLGDRIPLPYILLICIIAGPILGIAVVYIFGVLMHWIGIRFSGQASPYEVRAAFAWSAVPNLCVTILSIPLLILLGEDYFKSTPPDIFFSPVITLLFLLILVIQIVISIWAIIIFIVCLSEVHRFSIWKSVATSFVSVLIIFVPLYFILLFSSAFTMSP